MMATQTAPCGMHALMLPNAHANIRWKLLPALRTHVVIFGLLRILVSEVDFDVETSIGVLTACPLKNDRP